MARTDTGIKITGVSPVGVNPTFFTAVMDVLRGDGATELHLTSGKRSDASHPGGPSNSTAGGVPDSNHLRGLALDGYAVINGKQVPLGLLPGLDQYNIRSGSSFLYRGSPDNAHIDAGYKAQSYTNPASGNTTLAPPATTPDVSWQEAVLTGIGAPITPQNIMALNAWQQAEGTAAAFNPLATTQYAQGAGVLAGNTAGVRNYVSPQQGVTATVQTLLNGYYPDVLAAFRGNQGAMAVGQAVANSPWGTGGGILRVLRGGNVPTTPSGWKVTGPAPASSTVNASPIPGASGTFNLPGASGTPRSQVVLGPVTSPASPVGQNPAFQRQLQQALRQIAASKLAAPGYSPARPPVPQANLNPALPSASSVTPAGDYGYYNLVTQLNG